MMQRPRSNGQSTWTAQSGSLPASSSGMISRRPIFGQQARASMDESADTAPPRLQICYVIPSLSLNETQHFAHLPHFLSEVSRSVDVHVVVEHSTGLPPLPGVKETFVLAGRTSFGRVVSLIRAVLRLRQCGCRAFFVRISAVAAFVLTILQWPLGLTVYYWVSAEIGTTHPREIAAAVSWRARLGLTAARFMERFAIRHATRFVTGPQRMAEYFVRHYRIHPSRVLLLDNDIDVQGYRASRMACAQEEARRVLGLPEDVPVVLYVGRVSYLKGGAHLPEIARRLVDRQPDTVLVAVGEVFLKDVRDALIQDPGPNHVRMTGALPHRDVLPYYRAADLLIMPSVEEGFPRRLLEAMALGVPFVAFDVGGVAEIVSEPQRRCLIRRGDVAGLIDAVVALLGDAEARGRLREAGFNRVEMFDTPRVALRFVDLIRQARG